jgi:hypothetical protein
MKNTAKYLLAIALFAYFSFFTTTGCGLLDDDMDDPKVELGDTLWVHNIQGADSLFTNNILAQGKNGQIYYSKAGGTLYWTAARIVAIDGKTGNTIWESETLDNIDLSSNIVVADDGTVYVIGYHKLYAINPSNGSFNWVWEVPTEVPNPDGAGMLYTFGRIGALVLLSDGSVILGSVDSGVYNRALYSISSSGNTNWYNIKAVGGAVYSGIVVGKQDKVFYYSSFEGKNSLFAVNGLSGAILWHKEIISFGGAENNVVLKDNGDIICSFILNAGEEYFMYTIDQNNGSVLKKSNTTSNANIKLLGPDGKIYQQGNGYNILKYDENTGIGTDFSTLSEAKVSLRPAMFNGMGQLIVVNGFSWVGHISTYQKDGTLDWATPFDGVKNHSLLLTSDEVIVGSTSNKIFAIQGNEKLASSGWPMKTHDIRNTNNINK